MRVLLGYYFNIKQWFSFGFVVLSLSVLLSACGGGSSTNAGESTGTGDNTAESDGVQLVVGLTDAEGDFLTYIVDVTSISLTKENGVEIDLLPESTRVDFAQYVELTEFLTMATAPAGVYRSASLTLDFTDAEITVQDESGNPVAASAIDEAGNVMAQTTVEIEFSDRDGFVLRPGAPSQLTLDFDLDASNEITIANESATVRVKPVLLADALLEDPKTLRLRGLLDGVNVENESFTMQIRPFRKRSGRFGEADVTVTDATSFEINGELVASEQGLSVLATLDTGLPTIVEGLWDREAGKFVAESIFAGSSVPWGEADVLRGTVVARDGQSLSVRGAIVELADGRSSFNDTISVTVSELTEVVKRSEDDVGVADISVGSAVVISGELTEENTLDASEGLVRIRHSSFSGTVVSLAPLAIDLSLYNGRRIDIYDFAGTGTSTESDANPDNYEVDTLTIDTTGIQVNDPLRIRGWTTAFGAAPLDFNAHTIANAGAVRAHMVVSYQGGSETAVSNLDENGIALNLEGAARHHMVRAGIPTNLAELDEMPLVAPGDERGIYTVRAGRRNKVYTFYNDFLVALTEHIENGMMLERFDAQGSYDSVENAFSTKRLRVQLTGEESGENDDVGEPAS